MMQHPANKERADRVDDAIDGYLAQWADEDSVHQDMITDILHHLSGTGAHPDEIDAVLRMARSNFAAEIEPDDIEMDHRQSMRLKPNLKK